MTHSTKYQPKRCAWCGKPFTPERPHGRFCCPYHRWLAWDKANPRVRANRARMVGDEP